MRGMGGAQHETTKTQRPRPLPQTTAQGTRAQKASTPPPFVDVSLLRGELLRGKVSEKGLSAAKSQR